LAPFSAYNSGSFISVSPRVLPGRNPIPFALARFHLEEFSPALYERFGIAIPPSVAASVRKRQAEFLAGRICAHAIFHFHGRSGACVGIGTHRAPQWPTGVLGSITHNARFSAAIISMESAVKGVGIDIETVIDPGMAQATAQQIANGRELGHLYASTFPLSTYHRLTLLFSAKESFFKAAFPQVGRFFEFDAVELIHFDPHNGEMHFRCAQTLSPGLRENSRFVAAYCFVDETTLMTAVVLA
jgi:enterobactin synthetase component D